MEKRTLYHWGREYIKGISAGGNYINLPRVITINIVDFDNIKIDDYHTCFHLWEDDHSDYLLTDAIEIHFISMVKYRKLKTGDLANNMLERWLAFFDMKTPDEKLQEVVKMDSAIEKAFERINSVMQDKDTFDLYQRHEEWLMDQREEIYTATEKGREEGIGIGIEKGKLEIAKNLLNEGMSVDIIYRVTGIDTQTIQSL
jgi:predicted transposase/invertase (TIGR01784 family)